MNCCESCNRKESELSDGERLEIIYDGPYRSIGEAEDDKGIFLCPQCREEFKHS
jgi:hypothetical protein